MRQFIFLFKNTNILKQIHIKMNNARFQDSLTVLSNSNKVEPSAACESHCSPQEHHWAMRRVLASWPQLQVTNIRHV